MIYTVWRISHSRGWWWSCDGSPSPRDASPPDATRGPSARAPIQDVRHLSSVKCPSPYKPYSMSSPPCTHYIYTSHNANKLHTYTGNTTLSFCPLTPSNTLPSAIAPMYRPAENFGMTPHRYSRPAKAATLSVKASEPSTVLGVPAVQRIRPKRLPYIEAYMRYQERPQVQSHHPRTTASPTPTVKIPVYASNGEGLQRISVLHHSHYNPRPLTPRTRSRIHTPSIDRND